MNRPLPPPEITPSNSDPAAAVSTFSDNGTATAIRNPLAVAPLPHAPSLTEARCPTAENLIPTRKEAAHDVAMPSTSPLDEGADPSEASAPYPIPDGLPLALFGFLSRCRDHVLTLPDESRSPWLMAKTIEVETWRPTGEINIFAIELVRLALASWAGLQGSRF